MQCTMRFISNRTYKQISFLLVICLTHNVCSQVTFLDNYINSYRELRAGLFNFIGRSDTDWSYNWNLERGKVQKPFSETKEFFCDPNGPGRRSDSVPISVHKLRPGDIDIIGAIGDSLTAGNGALATNILQVLIENKGVSWSIGGQGTWHKFFTLPNILKVFNPNLYGYSLSDGYSVQKTVRFNAAEMGAMSRDIPYEAKVLVKRMTSDPNVNIKKDWKIITILIGPNDICLDFCYTSNLEQSAENHKINLITALRTFRDNLPRTFINLVLPPSLKVITELIGKPLECESGHHIECPCLFSFKHLRKREQYFSVMERWKNETVAVANRKEFDREDFTVVVQPFLHEVTFPLTQSGKSDFTYMSLDCFHLSQKGYALASNSLWNNMLEPVGNKTRNWTKEFTVVKCPTEERPYLATRKNSRHLN